MLSADMQVCQATFQPVMDKLSKIVKLKTEYIAAITGERSVACKHGERECAGNMHQLCVQHNTPRSKNYQ